MANKSEREHLRCIRCWHKCKCVEAAGIWYCPNCGVGKAVPGDPGHCTYAFYQGCERCGLPGRGYAWPRVRLRPASQRRRLNP